MPVAVVPYSVLGTQLTNSRAFEQRAEEPGPSTAFVDPAGLPYITQYGPRGAGGAAGAIYKFLGISTAERFPEAVMAAITAPTHAKYATYGGGQKHAIHAVGPNFNEHACSWEEAVELLGCTYANVLSEFAETPASVTDLRLLPISGGIFAGPFKSRLPELTLEALAVGFSKVSAQARQIVLGRRVQMCVFEERELESFVGAFP